MQFPDKILCKTKRQSQALDMQEHPEKYSGEQIEAMMDELDQMPDVETAWQKFEGKARSSCRWLQIAASIIGVIMVSGFALAAIYSLTPTPSPKSDGSSYIQTPDTNKHSTPLSNRKGVGGKATIIFDNVPLDTMLMEMSDYYHVSVEFEREEARQLRLHFEWQHRENLDRVVERLNNFEAVNIIREPEKLIVK